MSIDTTALECHTELAWAAAKRFSQSIRNEWGARVRDIRIFGSLARGDATTDSDVDVAVMVRRLHRSDRDRASDLAFRIGVLQHGIVIMPLVLSQAQFKRLLECERAVALAIERESIRL